ncbi:MAG: ribonucleotide-diphosphate reductase subunit beta [Lachnospiraceae bacterium]
MEVLNKKHLFNANGDIEISKRKIIEGNTTNLNDFNNIKYTWTSEWYRQAMNNFWIPEEINLGQDIKDYRLLEPFTKKAFDKILSFLVFLDSIQTANLPTIADYVTANEVNLCLTIQAFQEAVHSQSYGYILDTICSPEERMDILYQFKSDEMLLKRNEFIGNLYNNFYETPTRHNFMKSVIANYILEGIYFYSGFMFFYNMGRNGKMLGTVQEIRYINRDENTHLWLFLNLIRELRKEEPSLFTEELQAEYREMIRTGVENEIEWAEYIIGEQISGLTQEHIRSYMYYLGNERSKSLGLSALYEGYEKMPDDMKWVNEYSDPNLVKTDFFEAKSSAYAKAGALVDDL